MTTENEPPRNACDGRKLAGFDGQCPHHATRRAAAESAAARKLASENPHGLAVVRALELAREIASGRPFPPERLPAFARLVIHALGEAMVPELPGASCTCDALAPKPEDMPCRRKGCKALPGARCATRSGQPHVMRAMDACDAVRQLCPVCVAKAKAAKPPVYSSRGGAYNQPAPRRASDPFRLQGGR